MTVKKLIGLVMIFIVMSIAWMILGVSNLTRTNDAFSSLRTKITNMYGDELQIASPQCYIDHIEPRGSTYKAQREYKIEVPLTHSEVALDVQLEQRKKGNLWFPTYTARYHGSYDFALRDDQWNKVLKLQAPLKSQNSIYDQISVTINGVEQTNIMPLMTEEYFIVLPDEQGVVHLEIGYTATGMETVTYLLSPDYDSITQMQDFTMTITTDFKNVDFPSSMMSPTETNDTESGKELIWRYNNAVTGKDIGLIVPNKLNPGDIVSRVTFFAPVSLFFFFLVLFVIAIRYSIALHPMHFFFLAATFFSFHLMYSYFSDHLNIYLSFGIASAVSLSLTMTYLRLFAPGRLAYLYAPIIQSIYLLIFSYSFFFKGITGMIVTICAVITLFFLMQITGKINWDEVFSRK
jgi:hypothetical protein